MTIIEMLLLSAGEKTVHFNNCIVLFEAPGPPWGVVLHFTLIWGVVFFRLITPFNPPFNFPLIWAPRVFDCFGPSCFSVQPPKSAVSVKWTHTP